VSDPSPAEIADCFDVRRVLEIYGVELAARRMTESQLQQLRDMVQKLRSFTEVEDWSEIYQEYVALDHQMHRLIMEFSGKEYVALDHQMHRLIMEFAGNKSLQQTWEQINMHVQMARVRYRRAEKELDLAQEEHEELLRVFEARDMATLQEVMSHHIE